MLSIVKTILLSNSNKLLFLQWLLKRPECLKKPKLDRERGPRERSGVREVEWARGRGGTAPGHGLVSTSQSDTDTSLEVRSPGENCATLILEI